MERCCWPAPWLLASIRLNRGEEPRRGPAAPLHSQVYTNGKRRKRACSHASLGLPGRFIEGVDIGANSLNLLIFRVLIEEFNQSRTHYRAIGQTRNERDMVRAGQAKAHHHRQTQVFRIALNTSEQGGQNLEFATCAGDATQRDAVDKTAWNAGCAPGNLRDPLIGGSRWHKEDQGQAGSDSRSLQAI